MDSTPEATWFSALRGSCLANQRPPSRLAFMLRIQAAAQGPRGKAAALVIYLPPAPPVAVAAPPCRDIAPR